MKTWQKNSERDHLVDQVEFYISYIKTLQTAGFDPAIIEENRHILSGLRKRLINLRG